MSRTSSIIGLAAAAALVVASQAIGSAPASAERWVHTWASMPQLTESSNMPPAPFTQNGVVMANATLRQTVHVSVGGDQLRLRFSNAFGGAPLPITAVTVAQPRGGQAGVNAVEPGTSRQVTFHGKTSTTIQKGAQTVSDPISFPLAAQANLTVTTYLAQGQASTSITSHPGSRTTSHLLAGNHVRADAMSGSTPTDHWYFLSGVEVLSGPTAAAAVVLGDSLTDGRGSTTNGNDRWPDQLLARLQSQPDTADVAVINQAAGGNSVLRGGLGPTALSRLDRDVLAQSGIAWLVVFEGVNDIGGSPATDAGQRQVAAELIDAYDQIIVQSHAQGIRVHGATLTPFGGNGYDDAAGHHDQARQAVNTWIRTSGRFDAVIDFDQAVRDPAQPRRLRAAYDSGDHLHLNPTGYRALADAVPAHLLTTT
ncbi:SGNH/GDSL hydrolase family protein [Saccharothrix luteola]|uniref:SGNH/GDSL hydrolase family protein n=1 Tax=Saccharothrix luteola TaxID=2893018 RepID=UPI001E450FA6|nr:SGNH/GDSL hydrolase family protein [Saccharothrix luteola]MCC8246258.1 SGNH/GDSL hydrolase family protein [Saccharothrix luteola]